MFGSYESERDYNPRYGRFNSEIRGIACRNYESALRGSKNFWGDSSFLNEKKKNVIRSDFIIKVNPEQSYKIQKILFKKGYRWLDYSTDIEHINQPYLDLSKDGLLTYSYSGKMDYQELIDANLFIKTNGNCIYEDYEPEEKINNKLEKEEIKNNCLKEISVKKDIIKYISSIASILGFLNMIFVVSLLFIPVINIIELNIIFFYFLLNFFLIPYTLSYSFLMYPSENKKIYFSIFLIQSIVSLYFIKTFFF